MEDLIVGTTVIGITSTAISLIYQAFKFILTPGFYYSSARYGRIGIALHYLGILDADAGAIFTTLGLTALQLPNMDQTHWSARALLVLSMALGILSVFYASSQQQVIGMLNSALEIRLWLSRGRVDLKRRHYHMPYRLLPLESSDAAIMTINFPSTLLQLAVFLYLIGFGLYLLFCWLEKVDSDTIGHRNIFIIVIVAMGCLYACWLALSIFRVFDVQERTKDFDLDRSEDFAKPDSQQQLEVWLKTLQEMQEMLVERRADYQTLQARIEHLLAGWAPERAPTREKRGGTELTTNHTEIQAHRVEPEAMRGAEENRSVVGPQDV